MEHEHTPGPWKVSGVCNGAVVADYPVPEVRGADAIEYYGGHCIAESIAPQNRNIIAAAPDMMDALTSIVFATGVNLERLNKVEMKQMFKSIGMAANNALTKARGL